MTPNYEALLHDFLSLIPPGKERATSTIKKMMNLPDDVFRKVVLLAMDLPNLCWSMNVGEGHNIPYKWSHCDLPTWPNRKWSSKG